LVNQYQKGKTSLDLNEARDDGVLGCSGISWTICAQSAPHSRQMNTATPHHSIFTDWMLFLMPTNSVKALKANGKLTILFKSSKPIQIGLCMLMSLSIHLHGLHLDAQYGQM